MRAALALTILLAATAAPAQWEIQSAPTTADLRGIDNVGHGVAWASGTDGTVLRTTNDGAHWQRCATPPDAEHLDFRGIQAFDEKTAIVMSSGKGPLSRLYKTTDACQTWKLLFTNPDPDGFWDAMHVKPKEYPNDGIYVMILGDPVDGIFRIWRSDDGGNTWHKEPMRPSQPGEGAFASSDSALLNEWWDGMTFFGTGGSEGARLFTFCEPCTTKQFENWYVQPMPMFGKGASSGIFSIATDIVGFRLPIVAVGGDYLKPDNPGVAAYAPKRLRWYAAQTPPHGFRSAVAYDAATKTWITVGPNGTDISTDDGRNWRALRPNPALNEPTDADQHWNALSLPFVVGPHGRIGKLRAGALPAAARTAKP